MTEEIDSELIEYVAQSMREEWAKRNSTTTRWEDLNENTKLGYLADAEAALRANTIWPRVLEERAFHAANPGYRETSMSAVARAIRNTTPKVEMDTIDLTDKRVLVLEDRRFGDIIAVFKTYEDFLNFPNKPKGNWPTANPEMVGIVTDEWHLHRVPWFGE